jgi:hypothetical protein
LQPRSSYARVERFYIALTPAHTNRAIWTLRHKPSYWRFDPDDVPGFRRLQALMGEPNFEERFQHADLRAYTRRAHQPQGATRLHETSLYLQLVPNTPFVLLTRNANQPISLLFRAANWIHAKAV